MTRVAIMQPTYLPWMGYFGLMQSVDLFVLLDCVQFAKRSWQQRNQIKTPEGAAWLTVPVFSTGKREQLITDVEIDRTRKFPASHEQMLTSSYAKAPFFDDYAPPLLSVLAGAEPHLAGLTIGLIERLRASLGVATPMRRASEFDISGANAELLAVICEQAGATEYVSPPGSKVYLDESDAFRRRGLPVRYFSFEHPTYPQRFGDFLPYLSVVDVLFNCGPQSLALIESGCAVGT